MTAPVDQGAGSPRLSPRVRLGAAAGAWFIGAVVSSIFALGLAEALGYDLLLPSGRGTAIGRAAIQAGSGQPLDDGGIPIQWTVLFNTPQWVALIGLPVFLASMSGVGLATMFGLRFELKDVRNLAAGVGMQLLVLPVLYLVYFEIFGEADLGEPARALAATAKGWGVIVFFVMVVVIAPVAEELFFRGLIFGALREFVPDWVAIVISAAVFAGVHFQLLQFVGLFVLGILLAVQTQRSGRLGPAIVTHAGFNALTALSLIFLL